MSDILNMFGQIDQLLMQQPVNEKCIGSPLSNVAVAVMSQAARGSGW